MWNEYHGRAQVAILTIMRALLSRFTDRASRQGPFFYQLTDLNPGNIFVDSQWQIKYLFDLEWACSLPLETLHPPHWLTNRNPREIRVEELETFSMAHDKFLEIFEEEEKQSSPLFNVSSYRTNIMRKGWEIGKFWYFQALYSPKNVFAIFIIHIQPGFSVCAMDDAASFSRILSDYWAMDTKDFMVKKVKDKETCDERLRLRFQNDTSSM